MLMEFRASNEVRDFFCCNDKSKNTHLCCTLKGRIVALCQKVCLKGFCVIGYERK